MNRLSKIWSRVAQMDWEERWTRLAQELNKRIDLTLYRCGLLSTQNRVSESIESRGNFFFSRAELPHLVTALRSKMGGEVESIVLEADKICRHRFRLLGYDDLDYGPQIDWHLDVAHGKRAPIKPWFKINFLDSNEVGDHKVIWELNRHQHLVTLAKAWLITRDERYTSELKTQWYSWQQANPYPIGINWASSLEVAFRSLSWLWALSLLSDSPALDAKFRSDMIRALALNGRYIERYLSTYFSPNTHLLGEAVALVFIGIMCPEIAAADRDFIFRLSQHQPAGRPHQKGAAGTPFPDRRVPLHHLFPAARVRPDHAGRELHAADPAEIPVRRAVRGGRKMDRLGIFLQTVRRQ